MTHGPNIFHEKFLNVLTKMKIQFMEICRIRWKHDLEGNITLNSYILLFSRSVISNSLQPHWLQHSRLPCPSPSPRACSNSCPSCLWCHPTISSSVIPFFPPSIFPSIRVCSNESILHIRWPKYWSLSFSISPSNEYSGLISFRMDWLDLIAVLG